MKPTGRWFQSKGPEAGSVLALPILLDWIEQASGATLLGFLPTMYKVRCGDTRQWLRELSSRIAARLWTVPTRV